MHICTYISAINSMIYWHAQFPQSKSTKIKHKGSVPSGYVVQLVYSLAIPLAYICMYVCLYYNENLCADNMLISF